MSNNEILIAFSQEQAARLLANYLQSQNISVEYQQLDGQHPHGIKLLDPLQLEQAKLIVSEFINNPQDQKYQQSAWQTCESVELRSRTNFSLMNSLRQATDTPISSVILLICLVIHILALLGWQRPIFSLMQIQPLQVLAENHQWWRLIGPAFIHFSLLHIVFNLLWWWMLGTQIEKKLGSSTLTIVFMVSALSSNVGQLMVSGPNFGGLSGVVYALVGFVWWAGWLRPNWGLSLPKPMIGFLLIWLLLGYADLLWVNMANTAHTVGLISGCALAWIYTRSTAK